jgi:hypothetical protein
MQFFLFIVEIPKPAVPSNWSFFLEESSAIAMPPGSLPRPAENAWLFPVEGSDTFALKIKACFQKYQLIHSSYLISGEITLMTQPKEDINVSKVLT